MFTGKSIYVDNISGRDVATCGSPSQPCKQLSFSIQLLKVLGGKIKLRGYQEVSRSIELYSNISISSWLRNKPLIARSRMVSTIALFVMKNRGLRFHLSNVKLSKIRLLQISPLSIIIIENLFITKSPGSVFSFASMRGIVLKVSNSSFNENEWIVSHHEIVAFITTENTLHFQNSNVSEGYGISVEHSDRLIVSLSYCTFDHVTYPLYLKQVPINKQGSSLSIENSLFTKSKGIKQTYTFLTSGFNTVFLLSSKFEKMASPIVFERVHKVSIYSSTFKENSNFFFSAVSLRYIWIAVITRCVFISNASPRSALQFFRNALTVTESSIFKNNRAASGTLHLHHAFSSTITRCNFSNNMISGPVMITDVSSFFIKRSIFVDNSADTGGGVSSFNSKGHIEDTLFINNSAGRFGSAIFNGHDLTLRNIQIKTFGLSTISTIYSYVGDLQMDNVSLTLLRSQSEYAQPLPLTGLYAISSSSINVTNGLRIFCPDNHNIRVTNYSQIEIDINVYHISIIECVSCQKGSYSIGNGNLYWPSSLGTVPIIKSFNCYKCPSGGNCEARTIAKDNYWGYQNPSTKKITFSPCAAGYCCSNQTTPCSSYNTCQYGKTGILCGTCIRNYTQNFFNKKCIPNNGGCNLGLFVTYFIGYILVYVSFWLYCTTIIQYIKCLYKSLVPNNISHKLKHDNARYDLLLSNENVSTSNTSHLNSKDTFSFSGAIKLMVFYFQVASLVHVQSSAESERKNTYITSIKNVLLTIFNFRLVIYRQTLPMERVDFLLLEFISFGLIVSFFTTLVVIYIVTHILKVLRLKFSRGASDLSSDTEPPSHDGSDNNQPENICFITKIKVCYAKLLTLNYIPIAKFSFDMINCTPIGERKHLYVFGELVCYTWWQKLIFGLLIPWVLLFPFALPVATRMLQVKQISSERFLLLITFPPYSIYYILKNYNHANVELCQTREECSCVNEILKDNDSMFRLNDSFINWDVVLLLRSLVITTMTTFVINPLYRLLLLLVVFFICLIHDRNMPFKNVHLNRLLTMTSLCLSLLVTCNILPAYSYVSDISGIPGIGVIMTILSYLEDVFVFMLHPVWLFTWFLCYIVENKIVKGKGD